MAMPEAPVVEMPVDPEITVVEETSVTKPVFELDPYPPVVDGIPTLGV